jgi:hypothetical protein
VDPDHPWMKDFPLGQLGPTRTRPPTPEEMENTRRRQRLEALREKRELDRRLKDCWEEV